MRVTVTKNAEHADCYDLWVGDCREIEAESMGVCEGVALNLRELIATEGQWWQPWEVYEVAKGIYDARLTEIPA